MHGAGHFQIAYLPCWNDMTCLVSLNVRENPTGLGVGVFVVCVHFFQHKNIHLIYLLMNELNKSYFLENKGDLILQLKHWRHIVWLFLKNKVLIVLVVVAYYVRSTEQ